MASVSTSDIYCAAFLLGNGGKLADSSRASEEGRGTVTFTIEGDRVRDSLHSYASKAGQVPIGKFVWAIRGMKALLHNDLCPDITRPRTPDLYFAAYLMAGGVEMERAETVGRRIFFHFKPTSPPAALEELRAGYIEGGSQVDARTYAHYLRELKDTTKGGQA